MKKKISKMLAMIMGLSMMLGVGMVSDAYAGTEKWQCLGVFNIETGETIEPCVQTFNSRNEWESHAAATHAGSLIQGQGTGAKPIPISSGTDINLVNSAELVNYDTLDKINGTDYFADEDTNVWQDGSIVEETRVTVQRTSTFEITIPKEVVLDGNTGTADYKVKVKGDIAGDQKITVTPDANFTLSEAGGKANVTATVTQPDTEYDYVKLQGEGTEYNGNIAVTLTAGEWSGKFNFNITFTN